MMSRVCASSIQRTRLVKATVEVVGELGFASATVGRVCACARVSRGTFYQEFDDLTDCFLAVLDDGHRQAELLLAQTFGGGGEWLDGVRAGLAALLRLLDDEPMLARVWFVETLVAGAWALERRERHLAALRGAIVERWPPPAGTPFTPLVAASVMESMMGMLHSRVLSRSAEPMLGLLGPLMGLIATVYLDAPAATAEIERSKALVRVLLAERRVRPKTPHATSIPAVLLDPRAHRARECLLHLASNPDASNCEIASAIGIVHPAQISRLLARLGTEGLMTKCAGEPGGPNAWRVTPLGEVVARSLHGEKAHEPSPGGAEPTPTLADVEFSQRMYR